MLIVFGPIKRCLAKMPRYYVKKAKPIAFADISQSEIICFDIFRLIYVIRMRSSGKVIGEKKVINSKEAKTL